MVHLLFAMTLLTMSQVFLQLNICIFDSKLVITSNRIIRENYRFINNLGSKLFI